MAKDIKEFMEGFDASFSDLFSIYAVKKGVSSVSTLTDLEKLGINSFKNTKIGAGEQLRIVNAFRRGGLTSGLIAVRNRNSEFRHSYAEATAEAFADAGVKQTMFEKYYSMETIQTGIKKLTKRVKDGKVTPEQFFKAATAVAYVSQTYSKSKDGIEYLAKFHEDAIPYFRGVAQLKKDGTAAIKEEYSEAFAKLGVNIDKLASCISGKELPEELTHENETVKKANLNLKNEPLQRLTTNGMKQTAYAGNQAYSVIVSELLKSKLLHGTNVEDSLSALTDQEKELVMPLLSMHGEKSVEDVSKFLDTKEAFIDGIVGRVLEKNPGLEGFSERLLSSVPEDLPLDEKKDLIRDILVEKVIEAGVSTGAFAADKDADFFYELSKGCAKSAELSACFAAPDSENLSFLYHEGEIYVTGQVNNRYVGPRQFQEIKERIELNDERLGCSADLSEARIENFVPNCSNQIVYELNSLHTQEKMQEANQEEIEIKSTQKAISNQQRPTGLYRSLPLYTSYVNMYQNYFQKYGIEIASKNELLAAYHAKEQYAAAAPSGDPAPAPAHAPSGGPTPAPAPAPRGLEDAPEA